MEVVAVLALAFAMALTSVSGRVRAAWVVNMDAANGIVPAYALTAMAVVLRMAEVKLIAEARELTSWRLTHSLMATATT